MSESAEWDRLNRSQDAEYSLFRDVTIGVRRETLREAADALREQLALPRLKEYGPHDVRGAALWDAGCWLDPDDGDYFQVGRNARCATTLGTGEPCEMGVGHEGPHGITIEPPREQKRGLADVWDEGWAAFVEQYQLQRANPAHPITRVNPYRS